MATLTETITTPLTKLFGIQHPILLAGMNGASPFICCAFDFACAIYACYRSIEPMRTL